jgi:hypothetical protein
MFNRSLVVVFAGLLCTSASAQTLRIVTDLSSRIEETSGLLYLNGRLLTHNDSGGSVKLYEVDTATGDVIDDVLVNGATLTDWEDMCADDEDIFVGDFGNNLGDRTSLKLYKIEINDFLDGSESTDAVELPFHYADQTNFDPAQFRTNFDAETLICYGDHLLIFSKNWGDGKTRIYPIDKDETSEQELEPIATIDIGGLVTGGVYDADKQVIMLVGYQGFIPFVVEMQVDGSLNFDTFSWERTILSTQGGSTQIEGISLAPGDRYFISGERTAIADPTLYEFTFGAVSNTTSVENANSISVYPNPANNMVHVEGEDIKRVELHDISGKLVFVSTEKQLQLGTLTRGSYTLSTFDKGGQKSSRILVLE